MVETPKGRRICERPQITVYDDVLDAAECRHVIAVAEPKMSRARVSGKERTRVSAGRTGSRAWVKTGTDDVTLAIGERLAELAGLPISHAESMQVIHYDKGQEYRSHYDAYDLSTEKGQKYSANGGQRLVTVLAYLNDVEAGGETGFPHLGLTVGARAGRILVFENCYEGTIVRHPAAVHEGCPVLAGDKWAFNLWFRAREREPV